MPFRYPLDKQEANKLCWAAIATSVDHYFNRDSMFTQCSVASAVLGRSCCSLNGIPDACNKVEYLETALDRVQRLESPPSASALAFSDICKLIDKKMPVCARIQWPNGEGHFVVICGYRLTKDKKEFVEISDSWYEDSILPYDEFKQAYQGAGRPDGGGFWSHTYRVKN